ncbi:MAG: HEAT repeat domain-containing protein [Acidobacteriota bacterium]|nr:HEAT repeat domain-containing protein [Acidobacteriota bacterium]
MTEASQPDPVVQEPVSPRQFEKVREVVLCLSNAVSSLKVFPMDHQTVKQFIQDLTRKMTAYLKDHHQLDIAVKEFSFVFAGKSVYRDTTVIKSLPFFFFKDGLQTLFFYEGLDREEIQSFIEMIREEFIKPPEDADVVAAMWERDFVNIQFYAPDDFLEAKILEKQARPLEGPSAKELLEPKIDTARMTEGRIEMTDEDRRRAEYHPDGREEFTELPDLDVRTGAETDADEVDSIPDSDADWDDEEQHAVEQLLRENRTESQDEEFIELMMELLHMQTDPQEFQSALDSLVRFNLEQIQKRNFQAAILLIRKIRSLFDNLADRAPEKTARLNDFLRKITSEKTVAAMKDLVDRRVLDSSLDAFINYMIILGADALPLAADFYESIASEEVRWRLENYFMTSASRDLGTLVALANDRRPEYSREVIRLLGRQPDKRAIPQFALFLGFQNSEIKRDAVKALGEIDDELAEKILAGFLNDADEGVRVLAAWKMASLSDPIRLEKILGLVKSKPFRLVSPEEKTAVLALLGRTGTRECLETLRKLVRKRRFFRSPRQMEIRLTAIEALGNSPAPEAVEILETFAESGHRKIREACRRALDAREERS